MHICCICTGNTCRSPMMACLLTARAAQHGITLEVSSAGVAAGNGHPASQHSVSCMTERGLDLSSHHSQSAQSLDLASIDQFHCMTENHAFALYDLGVPQKKLFVVNAQNGGVPDPYGGPLIAYQECAAVLDQAAQDIIQSLIGSN